jgi:drug/metabolite transporter (DMT)-like permease
MAVGETTPVHPGLGAQSDAAVVGDTANAVPEAQHEKAARQPRTSATIWRLRGYLCALTAMACWSPDAVLPRLAALYHGGTTLNMIFWKFLLVGLVNMLFSLSTLSKANEQQHSRCRLVQHTFFPCTLGGSALVPAALAMLFTMATNFGFIASYMTTKAANAVLLIEMNPLWSAALGWLLLSDRLPLRTVVTIFAAVLCALVSALGSSVGDSEGGSANVSAIVPPGEIVPLPVRASWYGNLIALCTGFCFTGFLRAPARATCREPALRARLVA